MTNNNHSEYMHEQINELQSVVDEAVTAYINEPEELVKFYNATMPMALGLSHKIIDETAKDINFLHWLWDKLTLEMQIGFITLYKVEDGPKV